MKKFTKILICFMLCVCGFGLVACGDPRTPEEKNFTYPSSGDYVYGNGGLAVKKGNYVYFVNGYKSIDDAENKNDTYTVGSLMLMKLGANGEVVTDDEGLLKDEYYITMSNALCGYEATDLFIYGDYLYFVSPCLENETGDEVWAKERVVFNRIKLDKSSEVEEVYRSGVKYSNLEYKYYQANNQLYILAWEKGNSYYEDYGTDALMRINASSKSSQKVANNVTDLVFAEDYSQIFFTKKTSDDDNYYLKQYNVASNNVQSYMSSDQTFTIQFVANGKVYITTAHYVGNVAVGSTTDLKVSTISEKSNFELFYAYEGTKELHISPEGKVVIAISDNVINFIDTYQNYDPTTGAEITATITDTDATSIDVIDYTNGSILYYDTTSSNSNIKLISYDNAIQSLNPKIETLTTIDTINEDYAYFDYNEGENYLYFYKKSGENYYLHRIKVNYNFSEAEEMFGVYLESDVPEVEEEETTEEE